jgi:DNA-binding IclR family transcriptional regulator
MTEPPPAGPGGGTASSRYNVPGLERGLALLQLFDRRRIALSIADMARALAIPRSTTFRIAHTLERLGFLERDGDQYRVGAAVLRLGFEYIASLEIAELGRPVVEHLARETGHAAQLVVRDGRDVVVVLKSAPTSAFASNVAVGTRLPAHATVLGRVLLLDADAATLRSLYPEETLPRVSAHTPRSVADLDRLIREDRTRGYAVSEQFFEAGICAIAAPVRDRGGMVAAAVSITVQKPELGAADARTQLINQVLGAAARLSHQLNYRPANALPDGREA